MAPETLQISFSTECSLQDWREARPRRYRNKQRFPAYELTVQRAHLNDVYTLCTIWADELTVI